ncbi:hypothetical protein Y032_0024g996 [Ancylostoma ceylanicum]|nr:hypothetical protein Y032_0024g996 [Ancylostoma ceylanicum]
MLGAIMAMPLHDSSSAHEQLDGFFLDPEGPTYLYPSARVYPVKGTQGKLCVEADSLPNMPLASWRFVPCPYDFFPPSDP